MERYIGLDVHQKSSTYAVISESGKRLSSGVVETNGRALIETIKTVPGRTHVCLEEGAQSEWLYEVLSPHVDEIVVTHLEQHKPGRKDDLSDAFSRAEELRIGAVKPVFKDGGRMGQLRAHVDVQAQVTADVVRVQNRLKALYRSRGVTVSGGAVYTQSQREDYLGKLPKAYQPAALLLYAQFDTLREVKKQADQQLIEQSHKHAIARTLETCPGLGPIRVAQLLATVLSPHRFRGARQLWSYSGLGVVMRSSRCKARANGRSASRRCGTVSTDGAADGGCAQGAAPGTGGRITIGRYATAAEARQMRDAALLARADVGVGVTLRTFGETWLHEIRDLKSIDGVRSAWRSIILEAPFIDEPIATLTTSEVDAWARSLPEKRKKRSVLRGGKRRTIELDEPISCKTASNALGYLQLLPRRGPQGRPLRAQPC